MQEQGMFYIGKEFDIKKGKILDRPVLYDADDLTTHGVVVGMTGSGKTGLSVDILEEAALNDIPAILIDPKGEVVNLLLHFPELLPSDFQPWVDPSDAKRKGLTIEDFVTAEAEKWRAGLADWGIDQHRIAQLQEMVDYQVFTPGSDAGIPVDILGSLSAPEGEESELGEFVNERIASTVTALLGLVGIDADPVQSREHILLSNLFQYAWGQGKDLTLTDLVLQIQNPPISKLGAFDIESFFPKPEREKFAITLNNLLASPRFKIWSEGIPLEVESLLWAPDGKARQSIFYLAHLPDNERMFFVTVLLTAVESWMRTQSGSSSLRAILYFDEVLGYMPPVKNPPSKEPLLRLLKQARTFGLGLLLVTQNPADLDYKGLSNAGTWFVGHLQAERDKERLLDGLEGLDAGTTGMSRSNLDNLISSLSKRVFLLHNVHEEGDEVFYTRWAMAYLPGPITRAKIKDLESLSGAEQEEPGPSISETSAKKKSAQESGLDATFTTRPSVPTGVEEYFLSNNVPLSQAQRNAGLQDEKAQTTGLVYEPALLAQSSVRFLDRKIKLDHVVTYPHLVLQPDRRGVIHWEDHKVKPITNDALDPSPTREARYRNLEVPLTDAKLMRSLKADFADYVYRSASLHLWQNEELDLVGEPGMSEEEFRKLCEEKATVLRDEEVKKLKKIYEKKMDGLKTKLSREERELAQDQAEHSSRKMEEMITHAENVFSLFGSSRRSRRLSSSMTKRRLASQAKADVEESLDAIEEYQEQLVELESILAEELDELNENWMDAAEEIDERIITPYKKYILSDYYGVAWIPSWMIAVGEDLVELPAYQA